MKLFLQKNAKFSSAGGSAPRPPKQPHHCEFLATRLLTVKPALEKRLSEEADGAGMQRLLQIGELKICGPPFHVSIKRLKSFSFGEPRLGKRFFIFAHPENFMCPA